MALRASAHRLLWSPGNARDRLQPSAHTRTAGDVIKAFQQIKRLARQNGTIKRTFQIQWREKPTDRRKWNAMDKAYFQRWHYLKYCTEVVKYSLKHGLSFRNAVEEESFRPHGTWAEGVKTDSFGSGRLLRHHLEEVRMDRDGQRLNLEEARKKYGSLDHATLVTHYWKHAMKEVRRNPEKGVLQTFEELRKTHPSKAEADILGHWEEQMQRLGNPISVVYKLDPARPREFDETTQSMTRKAHTVDELTKQYDGDLLLNNFRHTMELMGSPVLPKIIDKAREQAERGRRTAERQNDRGFSVEELRDIAHGRSRPMAVAESLR